MAADQTPVRGEIWWINFDPSLGDEIQKVRPAVVMNNARSGRLKLRIVIPITTGNDRFKSLYWMTFIEKSVQNGLQNDSFADAFQVKSVSIDRFTRKSGVLTAAEMQNIVASVELCIKP